MKIVRLVSVLDFGGVEKVVELAALEISKRKEVELWVVVISNGGKTSHLLSEKGVKVLVLNQKYKIPNFYLIFVLTRFFQREKIEVLHATGAEANFHGLWAAVMANVKVRIGEEIGFPNHHVLWEWVFKITYSFSHRVIAVSKAVEGLIVKKREISSQKTTVIYNPVQIGDNIPTEPHNSNIFQFVAVARLVAIKNLEGLIRAFHLLEYEKKSLTIIGDGPDKERLLQLVEAMNISHKVFFYGYQAKVMDYLLKADCFVLPSFSEGSSVALAEAMLAELPSIVTVTGGASEILGNSNSSLFINPYDLGEIKSAMLSMIRLSDRERKEMGKRARQHALENFSPAKHTDQLLALYTELYGKN